MLLQRLNVGRTIDVVRKRTHDDAPLSLVVEADAQEMAMIIVDLIWTHVTTECFLHLGYVIHDLVCGLLQLNGARLEILLTHVNTHDFTGSFAIIHPSVHHLRLCILTVLAALFDDDAGVARRELRARHLDKLLLLIDIEISLCGQPLQLERARHILQSRQWFRR